VEVTSSENQTLLNNLNDKAISGIAWLFGSVAHELNRF
jgi:hypothetical protein